MGDFTPQPPDCSARIQHESFGGKPSPLLDISCFYSVHQTARILADFIFLSPHPESAKTPPPPTGKTCPDLKLLFAQFPSQLITLLYFKYACLIGQSRSSLCDPLYCSPPGSSVHGILQARTLEWVVHFSSSRRSSWPRGRTRVSCVPALAGGFFTHWDIGEALFEVCCWYFIHSFFPLVTTVGALGCVPSWSRNPLILWISNPDMVPVISYQLQITFLVLGWKKRTKFQLSLSFVLELQCVGNLE